MLAATSGRPRHVISHLNRLLHEDDPQTSQQEQPNLTNTSVLAGILRSRLSQWFASYDKYRIAPFSIGSILSLDDSVERSGSIWHVDVEHPSVGINQKDVPEPGQHCCDKPRFEVCCADKTGLLNHVN